MDSIFTNKVQMNILCFLWSFEGAEIIQNRS